MNYSAWHALGTSEVFPWFLGLAAVVIGFGYPTWMQAAREYWGRELDPAGHAGQLDWPSVLAKLQQDRTWQPAAITGPALMTTAVGAALHAMGLCPNPAMDWQRLSELLQGARFKLVTGHDAQRAANQGRLAVALDPAVQAAAVVIPGTVYPGTPLGTHNALLLGAQGDRLEPRQAALVFVNPGSPVFYILENLEPGS